jgi:hypothetical protein
VKRKWTTTPVVEDAVSFSALRSRASSAAFFLVTLLRRLVFCMQREKRR